MQQGQASLAIAQKELAVFFADHFVQAGKHLLADGVEVAQFEVVIDVKDAVHDFQHGAGPHAAQFHLFIAVQRGVHQQVQRVFRLAYFKRDKGRLGRRQEAAADEVERFAVGAGDHLAGVGIVDVETVFAHELVGVVLVAQGQSAEVDCRHA